jgi:hypothetical protein
MRRERSADLLQDILDFIDRIESWTPAEAAVDADEKKRFTPFFMPCSTSAKPFRDCRTISLISRLRFRGQRSAPCGT